MNHMANNSIAMQKHVKKIFAFSFLFIILLVGSVGIYMYNKPHADISKMTPDFVIDAKILFEEFESDEELASQKYIDKVLQVNGALVEVNRISDGSVILSLEDFLFGVSCSIDSSVAAAATHTIDQLSTGDLISVKGQCDGMLTDVKLSHCVLVN
jgi:hypothetical protein